MQYIYCPAADRLLLELIAFDRRKRSVGVERRAAQANQWDTGNYIGRKQRDFCFLFLYGIEVAVRSRFAD